MTWLVRKEECEKFLSILKELNMTRSIVLAGNFPNIVCLCGPTKFYQEFDKANFNETLAGNIVLNIGCNTKQDNDLFNFKTPDELDKIKNKLDELHKRKIDLADEILVLNVGGYIGESTFSEMQYAGKWAKPIRFLEERKLKVFQMNQYDWFADYSLVEAKHHYSRASGMDVDNIFGEDLHELTKEEMATGQVIDIEGIYKTGKERWTADKPINNNVISYKIYLGLIDEPQLFCYTKA